MEAILLISLQFILSCLLVAWAADRFIVGSIRIGQAMGLSALALGIFVVGFGTSLPEMVVSALAAMHGNPGVAIGNVVGSNIANIGLCVGVTALIRPIAVHARLLTREFPILVCITLIVWGLLWNGHLTRLDGVILLILLGGFIFWFQRQLRARTTAQDVLASEWEVDITPSGISLRRGVVWWAIGLAALLIGSDWLVTTAVKLAVRLGVSDWVIGVSVVAIGTSLPELAASIAGILKQEPNIAIGNIIGSNIFNLTAVLIFPALIHPTTLNRTVIVRDYAVMFGFTLLLGVFAFLPPCRHHITRLKGLILLLGYVGFLSFLLDFGQTPHLL